MGEHGRMKKVSTKTATLASTVPPVMCPGAVSHSCTRNNLPRMSLHAQADIYVPQ